LSQNTGYEVPFFYRNRMYHDAFQMIHGPRLYITGSGGYDTAAFFEKKLGIEGGDELDEGHNVVNFCVEVAQAMGCDPILFVGMDLAFTGMKEYAPGVVEDAKVSQSTILDVEDEDDKAIVKNDIFGQPTYTLWKWVAESEWIGEYGKEHPMITMMNCTEGGLGFPGIPNISLQEAADQFLTRTYEIPNRIHGETQNSTFKGVTTRKVIKAMHELRESLHRVCEHLAVLQNDMKEQINKVKAGNQDVIPAGKAALAEVELAEEIGYQHVISVFNEVYAHLLSGDIHTLQVAHYSAKQRHLKRLELGGRKYTFLSEVAQANEALIQYALSQHKKRKKEDLSMAVELPIFDPGRYEVANQRMIIEDPDCDVFIDEPFNPILVPEERTAGKQLENGHMLRMIFDAHWKLSECYVEKEGKPDGQLLLFYPEGEIKAENFYLEGKLHGPSRFFSQKGGLLAESFFLHGKQEGKSQWYYPSGSLYSLQRYHHGLWHGPQEYYDENGELKTLVYYDHGKLVGKPFLKRT
jgi:hypothetical protein